MANRCDPNFQRRCGELVEKHVYGRCSMLISDLRNLVESARESTLRDLYAIDHGDIYDWFRSLDKRQACEELGISFEKDAEGRTGWRWDAYGTSGKSALAALIECAEQPWFEDHTGFDQAEALVEDWAETNLGEDQDVTQYLDPWVVEAANEAGISISKTADGTWEWAFSEPELRDLEWGEDDAVDQAFTSIEEYLRGNDRIEEFECEVYEHWAVSGWLAYRLRGQGEETFELDGLIIWKRCTTGQSISMDGCICNIVENLDKE